MAKTNHENLTVKCADLQSRLSVAEDKLNVYTTAAASRPAASSAAGGALISSDEKIKELELRIIRMRYSSAFLMSLLHLYLISVMFVELSIRPSKIIFVSKRSESKRSRPLASLVRNSCIVSLKPMTLTRRIWKRKLKINRSRLQIWRNGMTISKSR